MPPRSRHLLSNSYSADVLLPSAPTTSPCIRRPHRDAQQMLTDRRDRIPCVLTLTAMFAVAKSSLRVPGVAHSRA